jgi:hypothetical protein
MQKKNEPVYCVGCQDADVLALTKKLKPESEAQQVETDEFIAIPPTNNTQHQTSNSKRGDLPGLSGPSPSGLVKLLARQGPHSGEFINTVDVIKSKISWATNALNSSTNVSDITQLCLMIKAASEAIHSLRMADV